MQASAVVGEAFRHKTVTLMCVLCAKCEMNVLERRVFAPGAFAR
jgi:hypothetical protein